jgi:hypothetical protein
MIAFASAMCLIIVAALCLAGIFSRAFHDNWLQFCGLVGLMAWATARAYQILDGNAYISTQQLVAHAALASYALGTAYKVWILRPKQPCPKRRAGERRLSL